MDQKQLENQNSVQLVQREANYKQQVHTISRVSSAHIVQTTSTNVNKVTRTATKTAIQQSVKSAEDEDYKQKFTDAQKKFMDLKEELKSTRSKLGTLNMVCANAEEKIGALKNLQGMYS